MEVLASGSHELLREEIGLSVYAMASADFEVFFQQTLPSYLVTCQGIDDQQRILLKNSFTVETVISFISPILSLNYILLLLYYIIIISIYYIILLNVSILSLNYITLYIYYIIILLLYY